MSVPPAARSRAHQVVLVDAEDREVGTADKLAAHRAPGQRHRAFSVFIHDGRGRLLLQRRATTKYHFGGRWTNTCCSHPRPDEGVDAAARRRLRQEMGLGVGILQTAGRFEYVAADPGSGLVEHELDHVVVGRADHLRPCPAPAEVAGWRWIALAALRQELRLAPHTFTPWFAPALDLAEPWLAVGGPDAVPSAARPAAGRAPA